VAASRAHDGAALESGVDVAPVHDGKAQLLPGGGAAEPSESLRCHHPTTLSDRQTIAGASSTGFKRPERSVLTAVAARDSGLDPAA
jgi:hypothetical protein